MNPKRSFEDVFRIWHSSLSDAGDEGPAAMLARMAGERKAAGPLARAREQAALGGSDRVIFAQLGMALKAIGRNK